MFASTTRSRLATNLVRPNVILPAGPRRAVLLRAISRQWHIRSYSESGTIGGSKVGGSSSESAGGGGAPKIEVNDNTYQSRISPLLAGLLVFGVAITGYGLYGMYAAMTHWPPEIRKELLEGVKAKHRGNLHLACQSLGRAWEKSKKLPISSFQPDPYLKTSGIAISYASTLEEDLEPDSAYLVYADALAQLQAADARGELSGPEKLRAATIAYKLTELGVVLEKSKELAERLLTWSVSTLLKASLKDGEDKANVQKGGKQDKDSLDKPTTGVGLVLPVWATKTDLAAPFEALGTHYAQAGNAEWAMPLYLQALAVLTSPAASDISVEDRCRGAQVMNNIAGLLVKGDPKALEQAQKWIDQALEQVQKASKEKCDTCETALVATLYNSGRLKQLAGDNEKARELFMKSLKHANEIGMVEGIKENEEALEKLDSSISTPTLE